MIKPVILWTDALIFLLVTVVIVFIVYARGKPHLRAPWQHVLRSRIAASSLVILLAFITTGLLDSLHFRLPLADNGNRQADPLCGGGAERAGPAGTGRCAPGSRRPIPRRFPRTCSPGKPSSSPMAAYCATTRAWNTAAVISLTRRGTGAATS